jgi:hypothetical protein
VRFLKHHASVVELIDEIDEPTRKSLSTNNNNASHVSPDRSLVNDLPNKLRRKVNLFFTNIFNLI